MNRRGILAGLTTVDVVLYPWLYRRLFGLGAVYLLPPALLHASRDLGGHAALMALHWVVTLALAMVLVAPIAILIALAFRRAWWVISLLFGALLLAPEGVGIPDVWSQVNDHNELLWILSLNLISVFAVPLISTYAALRLTSNYRWSGP